ncbi:hypothetical protein [Mesorhizobium sp. WSM2239]|uniref:Uncharacterized protein n=2 Tax=unclassified Mesorhizobium TaxID=325217 RepID=A0AAU8D6M1_9HYPH
MVIDQLRRSSSTCFDEIPATVELFRRLPTDIRVELIRILDRVTSARKAAPRHFVKRMPDRAGVVVHGIKAGCDHNDLFLQETLLTAHQAGMVDAGDGVGACERIPEARAVFEPVALLVEF